MHDGRNHCGTHRYWQTHNISLRTHIRRFLGLNIETGQPQGATDNNGKRRKPTELIDLLRNVPLDAGTRIQTPAKRKYGLRSSDGDHVHNRVMLDADVTA